MSEWKWAILAAAVFIAAILFCALPVSAQGAIRVHGIVQDADTYEAVPGGHIWLERQWVGVWFKMLCCESDPMQGHAFGWDLTQPGRYRVRWAKAGYEVVWIRSGEFDLATAPFGDILISVRRMTGPTATPSATREPTATRTATPRATFPVPTTLYPPTVDPTRTATPTRTPAPCLDFQQFTQEERRSVIATALLLIGHPLEDAPDVDNDPTLLHGLRDMMLGAPLTVKFEVMGLTARGFCDAIIVMRPVSREECFGYGVVTWDSGQNYEPR
jgi:hypothetical protein